MEHLSESCEEIEVADNVVLKESSGRKYSWIPADEARHLCFFYIQHFLRTLLPPKKRVCFTPGIRGQKDGKSEGPVFKTSGFSLKDKHNSAHYDIMCYINGMN